MAGGLKLNFDKLFSIANKGSNSGIRSEFFNEVMKQWEPMGNDPNASINDITRASNELFDGYKSGEYGGNTRSGGYGGGGNYARIFGRTNLMQGTTSFALDALQRQQRGGGMSDPEFGSLEKGLGIFFDRGGIKSFKGMWTALKDILKDEILIYLEQQTKLYESINEQGALSGELAAAFRDELMLASPEVIRLGISFDEMSESVGKLLQQSGKFKLLSDDTIEQMALASKFTDDMSSFVEMADDFERIGLGVRDMSSLVEKMGLRSMVLGLNARRVVSMVNENLANLNKYGFKEGVEGLSKMAQKSIEFRMNMGEVFKMADKVWEPDKALELVANLQVIGGAFGDLNDPLKLMYMATNNVEGLQDALIGAAQSLATYNEEQGRFEITGVNLRRAKAMADELGVTLDDLTNGAIAAMERTAAQTELMSKGLTIREEDREFLINLSRMEGGRMIIEVPQPLREQLGMQAQETKLAIEDMTAEQANILLEQKEAFEKMTMEDVARQQVTLVENIQRDVSFLRAVARVGIGKEVGDLIERSLGINQRTMSESVKGWTDSLAEDIKAAPQALGEVVEEAFGMKKNNAQKTPINAGATTPPMMNEAGKPTSSTSTAAATTTTQEINHNLKFLPSDAVYDSLKRAMWNDPQYQEDFKRSFLNIN